jgi:hypothetical protein
VILVGDRAGRWSSTVRAPSADPADCSGASEDTMTDAHDDETQGDEGEAGAVEVTSVTEIDVDGDGAIDVVEVSTATAIDVDGDGVADAVVVSTATAVDLDGDGVADVVEVVEAVGVDVDGDGVIDDDEIEVSSTVYVRDDEDED